MEYQQKYEAVARKIPDNPGIYRHSINQTYYGIKKLGGKRKEHSLDTTDRQIAERRLRQWIRDLDKADAEAEKMTLGQLIEKFAKTRRGKAEKTRKSGEWSASW